MRRPYVVYNAAGVILRTGRASNVEIQTNGPDEFVIEGVAGDLDHRVDPHTRTLIPAPEIRAAHNAAALALANAASAKRNATIAKLNAIITNPTTDPAIRTLAEIELART